VKKNASLHKIGNIHRKERKDHKDQLLFFC